MTKIFGIRDDFVFAADFSGSIYHWNGETWSEMLTGVTSECGDMSGDGPNNVYAVTGGGAILHFDGHSWSRVRIASGELAFPVLTGVRMTGDRKVYVTQNRGVLFRGDAAGFEPIAETPYGLYGVAFHSDTFFWPECPAVGCATAKGGASNN